MNNTEQTVPELVGWVKQHDFSLALPAERLAFYLRSPSSAVIGLMKSWVKVT